MTVNDAAFGEKIRGTGKLVVNSQHLCNRIAGWHTEWQHGKINTAIQALPPQRQTSELMNAACGRGPSDYVGIASGNSVPDKFERAGS